MKEINVKKNVDVYLGIKTIQNILEKYLLNNSLFPSTDFMNFFWLHSSAVATSGWVRFFTALVFQMWSTQLLVWSDYTRMSNTKI